MKIVILGAGTTAKSVANILIENNNFKIAGFLGNVNDEKKYINKNVAFDIPYLGNYKIIKYLIKDKILGFVVAIGDNKKREEMYYNALNNNLIPISAISKNSIISNTSLIERGSIVKSGSIIGHNVKIRQNVKIESGAIVETNSEIGSNCTIGVSAVIMGECKIKKNVAIGAKVLIKPYLNIGKNQTIEDGEIIRSDLEDLERV